jgi:hypothetical protein
MDNIKIEVKRGQVIDYPSNGKMIFEGLDFYMGGCTVKLKGITYPGYRYPGIEEFEKNGFTIIDR